MGIAYVHISVDAGTPETYANLKARNCTKLSELPKAWKVIEAIAERKRNTGSGLDINCSYIMYPENFREIYEAAKALKGCGCEILRIKQDNSGNRLLSQNEAAEAEFLLQRIQAELVDDGFKVVTLHKLGMTSAPVRQFSKCRITELMAAVGSDGCLYPCNYHPRPNGASYGSAIELGFKEVWESSVRSMMKKQIPSICPAVCDPFKGRANNLLEIADREVDRLGHVEFLDQVHSIVNK